MCPPLASLRADKREGIESYRVSTSWGGMAANAACKATHKASLPAKTLLTGALRVTVGHKWSVGDISGELGGHSSALHIRIRSVSSHAFVLRARCNPCLVQPCSPVQYSMEGCMCCPRVELRAYKLGRIIICHPPMFFLERSNFGTKECVERSIGGQMKSYRKACSVQLLCSKNGQWHR